MSRYAKFLPVLMLILVIFSSACRPAESPVSPDTPIPTAPALTATSLPISTDTPASTLSPTDTVKTGKIVFVSCNYASVTENGVVLTITDEDSCDIHVMNMDGSGQINLTANHFPDTDPAWSPDGRKIAFVSRRDGNAEIYVMNADGSDQTRLTNTDSEEAEPAWSPDASRIMFVEHHLNGPSELKVMTPDGTPLTTLAINEQGGGNFLSPTFSPDGRKIALVQEGFPGFACQGCSEIFVMDADGSHMVQITNHHGWSHNPAWSPDGKKIAYETYGTAGDISIFAMDPDGKHQTLLANTESSWDAHPGWSPDGNWIVFQSNPEQFIVRGVDIYLLNIKSAEILRLTTNENSHSPAFMLGAKIP